MILFFRLSKTADKTLSDRDLFSPIENPDPFFIPNFDEKCAGREKRN